MTLKGALRRASGVCSLGGAGLVTEAREIPSIELKSPQAACRFTADFGQARVLREPPWDF
jgi:hypothetical protein